MKYYWWILIIITILVVIISITCIEYSLRHFNFHQWRRPELYDSTPFMTKMTKKDWDVVKNGQQRAKTHTIVFTGLCRNVADVVSKNISMCCYIGNYFQDYQIVLFENDSEDDTRKLLLEWKKHNNRIEILDCPDTLCNVPTPKLYSTGPLSTYRFQKMASFRNIYLDHIKKKWSPFDYMMVIDFDMLGSTNLNGIFHSIGQDIEWDAISNTGFMNIPGSMGFVCLPYDVVAIVFQNEDLVPNRHQNRLQLVYRFFVQVYKNMSTKHLIRVRSSFHGMMLYKLSSVIQKGARYSATYGCEHIAFNSHLSNVFINPLWTSFFGIQGPREIKQLLFQ